MFEPPIGISTAKASRGGAPGVQSAAGVSTMRCTQTYNGLLQVHLWAHESASMHSEKSIGGPGGQCIDGLREVHRCTFKSALGGALQKLRISLPDQEDRLFCTPVGIMRTVQAGPDRRGLFHEKTSSPRFGRMDLKRTHS